MAKWPVPKKDRADQWESAVTTINRKCYDAVKNQTPKRPRRSEN